MKSSIVLQNLELPVYIGWLHTERLVEQIVAVNIMIKFNEPPRACTSDDLADTFCYDALVNAIKTAIAERKFHLLEHFGHELYQIVKQQLDQNAMISIRVTKKPAIPNLQGGVAFSFGDFE